MLHGIHPYNILLAVLTLVYCQCIQFVFRFELAHSWQWLNSVTETQTNRRRIYLFTFSYLSLVFYTTIMKNVNLINIPINITENKVGWNIYQGKTSANTHLLYTTASRVKWRPRRGRQTGESRVLVRMPGWVNLLLVAILAHPILVS